jgi:hypothetical protein
MDVLHADSSSKYHPEPLQYGLPARRSHPQFTGSIEVLFLRSVKSVRA